MRFKVWIQNEIASTHTDLDPSVPQGPHYMMVRNKKKGGGALPEFSLKDEPKKQFKKSPTKEYEDPPLANYIPSKTFNKS